MDDKLVSILIGIISGAVGYWISTFWMKPILRYLELRSKILSDLVYYAQVINADGLNERMQNLFLERIESNRRTSAELIGCILELPCWYLCWLKFNGCNPEAVAQDLIGLSNTTDYEVAEKRIERVKKYLCIRSTIV